MERQSIRLRPSAPPTNSAAIFVPPSAPKIPFPATFNETALKQAAYDMFGDDTYLTSPEDAGISVIGYDNHGTVYGTTSWDDIQYGSRVQIFVAPLNGEFRFIESNFRDDGGLVSVIRPVLSGVNAFGYGWGGQYMHDPAYFLMLPNRELFAYFVAEGKQWEFIGIESVNDNGQILANSLVVGQFENADS